MSDTYCPIHQSSVAFYDNLHDQVLVHVPRRQGILPQRSAPSDVGIRADTSNRGGNRPCLARDRKRDPRQPCSTSIRWGLC